MGLTQSRNTEYDHSCVISLIDPEWLVVTEKNPFRLLIEEQTLPLLRLDIPYDVLTTSEVFV